jgi:predicted ribosomally synthesized peptide with nif11-like leader
MSRESFEKFREAVLRSEELRSAMQGTVRSEADMLALAARHGYEFTAEELHDGLELSEEELEAVAGGVGFIKHSPGFDKDHKAWSDLLSFGAFTRDLFQR